MIKNGKEYFTAPNGLLYTTGYELECVKKFHGCRARIVVMTRDYHNETEQLWHESTMLVSYETLVCSICRTYKRGASDTSHVSIRFSEHSFHSPTTIRQVSRFLNEQGFPGYYQWLKKAHKLKAIYQPAENCCVYECQLEYPKYWAFGKFDEFFW